MLWFTAFLLTNARAADWRFETGGEFNADSHGILEVGYHDDLIQVELLTNTLEAKRVINRQTGMKWGALRGEAVFAGLLPFPWIDGRPAPELGSDASQGRIELGGVRYYQWSMYAGGVVSFNKQWFAHSANSIHSDALNNRFVTHPEIILGRYTDQFHAYTKIGTYFINIDTDRIQNAITGNLSWIPQWPIAPVVRGYAGNGENLDAMHRFRIGGLNPYVIPMAGAGWGEWWVENYAVAQLGLRATWQIHNIQSNLEPFVDLAVFDSQSLMGVGTKLNLSKNNWFGGISWGWAPWIERAPGIGRQSLWVSLGQEYGVRAK